MFLQIEAKPVGFSLPFVVRPPFLVAGLRRAALHDDASLEIGPLGWGLGTVLALLGGPEIKPVFRVIASLLFEGVRHDPDGGDLAEFSRKIGSAVLVFSPP